MSRRSTGNLRLVLLLSIALTALATAGCRRGHRRAAPSTVERLRDSALSRGRPIEWVRSLVEKVGARMQGSEGDGRAVAWALDAMRSIGLEGVHAEPVMVHHWVRGAESAAIVSPSQRPLSLVALGGSVATPPDGLEAEVTEVASLAAFAALPDEAVRGKIVFFNAIMARARDGSGYGATVPVRFAGPAAASKRGALAVLVRSIATDRAIAPHTGATGFRDVSPIPAAALSLEGADALHLAIAAGGPVRVRLSLEAHELDRVGSANVVGEIRGRTLPGETVILSAHLDSWDVGPGALDDGAGVSIVLESARVILQSGARPSRTIRFVLFAAEERDGLGSKAYVEAHAAELARHTLVIEADNGDGAVYGMEYVAADAAAPAMATLAAPLRALDVAPPVGNPDGAHGDVEALREAGVPVVSLRQDASRYFDVHHSSEDTLDKVDELSLRRATAAFLSVAFGAADLAQDLGRAPPSAPRR